jgi:hypothetical protein
MSANGLGTISFRSSKFVDTSVGVDGQDSSSSQITGDRAIFISNDGERLTERLENISHKKRWVRLHPDTLDDVFADWVPVADDGCELLDTSKMDSVSSGADSKKRKHYKSSVCDYLTPLFN